MILMNFHSENCTKIDINNKQTKQQKQQQNTVPRRDHELYLVSLLSKLHSQ